MRVEVLTGQERRREWSEERKREIVALAFSPGTKVSEVARRLDVSAGQIYRWRKDFGMASAPGFAEVMIAPESSGPPSAIESCPLESRPVIAVDLGAVRVRIWGDASPDLAGAVVRALSGAER
jgi:transposase